MGQPQGQAGSRGVTQHHQALGFGVSLLPFCPSGLGLPEAHLARESARGAGTPGDSVHGHADGVPTAPSPPTDAESICLNTHKYLLPCCQRQLPGCPPSSPSSPQFPRPGVPTCGDGASHTRTQDPATLPGGRAPQPPWSPQPHTGVSSGPWGMWGTAPIGEQQGRGLP